MGLRPSLISKSFVTNKSFFQEHADSIYIISGGFREFICPVVAEFNIASNHVFANEFLWDEHDQCVGFNSNNLLSKPQGKVHCINKLNLQKPSCIIGDGFTDYEVKEQAAVDTFFLYTENITRKNLLEKADFIISTFDNFLKYQYKL